MCVLINLYFYSLQITYLHPLYTKQTNHSTTITYLMTYPRTVTHGLCDILGETLCLVLSDVQVKCTADQSQLPSSLLYPHQCWYIWLNIYDTRFIDCFGLPRSFPDFPSTQNHWISSMKLFFLIRRIQLPSSTWQVLQSRFRVMYNVLLFFNVPMSIIDLEPGLIKKSTNRTGKKRT